MLPISSMVRPNFLELLYNPSSPDALRAPAFAMSLPLLYSLSPNSLAIFCSSTDVSNADTAKADIPPTRSLISGPPGTSSVNATAAILAACTTLSIAPFMADAPFAPSVMALVAAMAAAFKDINTPPSASRPAVAFSNPRVFFT